ncbi:MAG: glycerophosphodiester phosphodiesterase [Candidatus Thorarchaeota archaeon]|nr:glycerophosphodiester phosphodiesterase [Candidatus Thorarchaeota archaeon]
MSESKIFDIGRPLVMAHRGDPSRAPENTLLSMQLAVDAGADVLETDLQLTADREFVLFHDEDLSRIAGMDVSVGDLTLDELREVDFGYGFTLDGGRSFPFRDKGHTVVTLREALEAFPNMRFSLDIRDLGSAAPGMLASILKELERKDSVIIASFTPPQLERFREIMPSVPTYAHPREVRNFVYGTRLRLIPLFSRHIRFRAFAVPIKWNETTVVSQRFVNSAHRRNIAVHVWTINDAATMEWLIDLGADGIFTDEPRLLIETLSRRGVL